MPLLYHQCYGTDVSAVTEESGGKSGDVCMSWSHTDLGMDETIVVILIAGSSTAAEAADGEKRMYLLKVSLFTGAACSEKGKENGTDYLKIEKTQREVHSALFELDAQLDPGLLKGTSGLIFVSTRQFFVSSKLGNTSLDRFLFLSKERVWERQCEVIRPLDDVESIRGVLAGIAGDAKPHILLATPVAISSSSSKSLLTDGEEQVDMLLVISKMENENGKGFFSASQSVRQRVTALTKISKTTQGAHTTPTVPCHTFIVSVVRCKVQAVGVTTIEWELLNLFVDRAVPFYMCTGGAPMSSSIDRTASDTIIYPNQCIWCYLQDPIAGSVERKKLNSEEFETERPRGVIVALVPQPSCTLTLVCGGFDTKCHSYRLGFTTSQGEASGDQLWRTVECDDNSEEALWSLADETHKVQMILLGTKVGRLRADNGINEMTTNPRSACGYSAVGSSATINSEFKSGWMRHAGLAVVLRFFVDFLDDGLSNISNSFDDGEGRGRQGLYTVTSTLWAKGRNGRFILPRNVCWFGLVPLPIGKAATSTLLFNGNDDEITNGSKHITRNSLDNDDLTAWYQVVPTSIASSFPIHTGNGTLCCFVSINTLLQKTRITHVFEMSSTTKLAHGQSKIQLYELLCIVPKNKANINEDVELLSLQEKNDKNDKLAVYLARSVAMCELNMYKRASKAGILLQDCSYDWISPEVVLYEAWRSVVMGKHTSTALYVLDQVSQSMEVAATKEVQVLANELCNFFLVFLVELDWLIFSVDSKFVRDVILLMLGAVGAQKKTLKSCCDASLLDKILVASFLSPNELRSTQLLLWRSKMWQPLAVLLFAWVNQKLTNVENGSEILLEEVVEFWRTMLDNEATENNLLDNNILKKLCTSWDAAKFCNSVAALLHGNLSMREVMLLAGFREQTRSEPCVILLQLFMEVTVAAENAAAISAEEKLLVAEIDRLCALTVQQRLDSSGDIYALVTLLSEWSFSFFEELPFFNVCGGLPVVYVLLHIAVAASAVSESESESEALNETCDALLTATRVLQWLCGDNIAIATDVLNIFCAAGVSLLALYFLEDTDSSCKSYFAAPFKGADNDSNLSKALHYILASPVIDILKRSLCVPRDIALANVVCGSEKLILTLWSYTLEKDEAATFNPKLLQQLYSAFYDCRNVKPVHTASRAALLLKFLKSVFLCTLPHMFAALGNRHETIGCIFSGTFLGKLCFLLDESETVENVWLTILPILTQLLRLHCEESLEIHCLLLLFEVFQSLYAMLLERTNDNNSEGSLTLWDVGFTFSPEEMYFLSLKILSGETAHFVVAVEVIRQSLRPFLLHKLSCALEEANRTTVLLATKGTQEQPADEMKELWCDSKAFLNDVADDLAPVISSFEKTAPLYSHAILLIFLEESLLLVEKAVAEGKRELDDEKKGTRVSLKVQNDMLCCARRAALSRWEILRRQEKRVLARVLSPHCLSLPEHVYATWNAYRESEAHYHVVNDTERLKKSLQSQTLDVALLNAVREVCFRPTLSTAEGPLTCAANHDNVVETVRSSRNLSDIDFLVKEETYVRQHLQLRLLHEYDEFIGSDEFSHALGVLYIALRYEKRRREFLFFVCDVHKIASLFAQSYLALLHNLCDEGVSVLWQNAIEELKRRASFLFRQERESRAAIEAVCSVERAMLYDQSSQQRIIFDAETNARFCVINEEEFHRDVIYELFAREEMEAQQRYEARVEDEAWREEEKRWAAEEKVECDEPLGNKNDVIREKENNKETLCKEKEYIELNNNTVVTFSQSQDSQISAMEENKRPIIRQSQITPPHMSTPSSAKDLGSVSTLTTHCSDILPPATALAPLLQLGSSAVTSKNGEEQSAGYFALLESPEILLNAFSRIQKSVISTVAPPPPSAMKKDTTKTTADSLAYPQRPQHLKKEDNNMEKTHNNSNSNNSNNNTNFDNNADSNDNGDGALSRTVLPAAEVKSLSLSCGDKLDDFSADDSHFLTPQACKNNTGGKEVDFFDDSFKIVGDDSSKRLRLRALATTVATGKRSAPRKRRLGDVVCIETGLKSARSVDKKQHQRVEEKKEEGSQQLLMSTNVTNDVVAPCHVTKEKTDVYLGVVGDELETEPMFKDGELPLLSLDTCGADLLVSNRTLLEENSVVVMGWKEKKEENDESEKNLHLCSNVAVILQSAEEAARFLNCRDEQVERAFIFRRFILEA